VAAQPYAIDGRRPRCFVDVVSAALSKTVNGLPARTIVHAVHGEGHSARVRFGARQENQAQHRPGGYSDQDVVETPRPHPLFPSPIGDGS